MIKINTENTGRASSSLQATLRKQIYSGEISVGDMLPSVRELSEVFKIAPKTVHLALKSLAKEGLAIAEPRKGYRVLARSNDPRKGCPIALVYDNAELTDTTSLHYRLRTMIENYFAEKSYSILSVFAYDRSVEDIFNQIKTGRAWGVLLDTVNIELLKQIKEAEIPAVMIDAWVEDAPFDVVLQDNYQGGFKAAMHLINQGHKEIAWVGEIGDSGISRERYGGASAALASVGLPLTQQNTYECNRNDPDELVYKILSSKNRPKAILSMWHEIASSIAKISRKLKLKIGKDFDLVGWATDDTYDNFVEEFKGLNVPPAIIWSPRDMARTAVSRIAERWETPDLPTLRLHIETQIKLFKIKKVNKENKL